MTNGKLIFEDGSFFLGRSFGAENNSSGEVVFSTGMVGYPESLTDPSYLGQILIFTYPLIGNYGVGDKKYWESDGLKISGLIVSNYIDTPSHFLSKTTLSAWLEKEGIPALEIPDTRFLTQKLRTKGAMLGKIIIGNGKDDIDFYNPNLDNLVSKVTTKKIYKEGTGRKILLIDCGTKRNIVNCLLKRNVQVTIIPSDFDPFYNSFFDKNKFSGIVISNGPGDPRKNLKTIQTVRKTIEKKIPILGICLGHQILALASEADTYKLKFGHRSQNQPCILQKSLVPQKCFITTQNHGFAVRNIPQDFNSWFVNANDQTNEGIIHKKLPIMSVQFHPEANPGPTDTEWIFDFFLKRII